MNNLTETAVKIINSCIILPQLEPAKKFVELLQANPVFKLNPEDSKALDMALVEKEAELKGLHGLNSELVQNTLKVISGMGVKSYQTDRLLTLQVVEKCTDKAASVIRRKFNEKVAILNAFLKEHTTLPANLTNIAA